MNDGEPDDRRLLADHIAGDPEAFTILVRRHRDRLWAVALRTSGNPTASTATAASARRGRVIDWPSTPGARAVPSANDG